MFGGRKNAKNVTSSENIISNSVGRGVFVPQINKIKVYYSYNGPLSFSLILSFAMKNNKLCFSVFLKLCKTAAR